jgi:hypothetical protein
LNPKFWIQIQTLNLNRVSNSKFEFESKILDSNSNFEFEVIFEGFDLHRISSEIQPWGHSGKLKT